MRFSSRPLLVIAMALGLAAVPGLGARSAGAVAELRPNLTPLQASELRTEVIDGRTYLRFSTTNWNKGAGPLELRPAGLVDENGTQKQRVNQRVFNDDGSWTDYQAGFFDYHPTHGHMHFNDFAIYELRPAGATGPAARFGTKVTFCIIDTTRVNTRLPGAPKKAVYKSCSATRQGMSVGWGDRYPYYLEGQSLETTGLADGLYELRITVDPKNLLLEQNEGDNVSTRTITLVDGRLK